MFDFIKSIFKPYKKIVIRYNTKNDGSDLVWRVFVDGEQKLASKLEIYGYIYDEKTIENGEEKMNIACTGYVKWNGTKAIIKGIDEKRLNALDGMAY